MRVAREGPPKGQETISSIAFSPDGQRIATLGSEDLLRVWNALSGEEIYKEQVDTIASDVISECMRWWEKTLAFSLDGRLLAMAGIDGTIRVWDTCTGSCQEMCGECDDVDVIAREITGVSLRAVCRDQQTVIELASTGEPIAWFPVAVDVSSVRCIDPCGHTWAGLAGEYVHIITLENPPEPADSRRSPGQPDARSASALSARTTGRKDGGRQNDR